MYLKSLKLVNFRKYTNVDNCIEFISHGLADIVTGKVDVSSDTTLIIGKNNAGKTTIITALEQLIKGDSAFGVNDFNYRYLKEYLDKYEVDQNTPLPYIEFVITIAMEDNSDDRISNLIPFMLVEDVDDKNLDICIRYEIKEAEEFKSKMGDFWKLTPVEARFGKFLQILDETKFVLNYYDKNGDSIEKDFKLGTLMEIKTIKANQIKNDHCLSDAFNKIVSYRYSHQFKDEKNSILASIENINQDLTKKIEEKQTETVQNVLGKMVSTERMGLKLSADITFEKLMSDLIKYEYTDGDINVPEDQFGLGYTNLIMIIASIMDYMEKYPDTAFNSKINLLSIEEPETYMHPQMQELFIKNINDAIETLLETNRKNINTQIIITTHSSHILNSKIHSANTFDNICYLHDKDNHSAIVNLNNDVIKPESEKDFRFLKKHIKFKVSELFFSDAVIFVEGFAEEMIIPYYLEQNEKLSKHYISVFNINGAHGYLYKSLIQILEIPCAIITDIDFKREKKNGTKDLSQITDITGHTTTNKTIINIYGKGSDDITNLPEHYEEGSLYLAYQYKVRGYYASSFEEAFILTNYTNDILNTLLYQLAPGKYKSIVGKKYGDTYPNCEKNKHNSYIWQHALENKKGDFASYLLYELVNLSEDQSGPVLPKYIADVFAWIDKQL